MPVKQNPARDPIQQILQIQVAVAKEKPWMASLLMTHSQTLFKRFALFYRHLAGLPRRIRRRVRRKTALTLAGMAFMWAIGQPPISQAASITVTSGAAGFVADGQCSLAEAIVNANDDAATHADCPAGSGADIITLAGNTYSYSIALGDAVGFGDSALPFIMSEITIDAAYSTIERDSDSPHFRIIGTFGVTADLTLNDAIISGGSITGTRSGGGLMVGYTGSATVNNSTFEDNYADGGGGGIYVQNNATLRIRDSIFRDNIAGSGGGIIVGGWYGGGSGYATIKNSTITSNYGENQGGGIVVYNDGIIIIDDSLISNNSATSDGAAGIFIYKGGMGTINNCTIADNFTTGFSNRSGGGVTIGKDSTVTINDSLISGNSSIEGGGVYVRNFGTVILNHSTISGNTAGTGGGIYVHSLAAATLNNCTVSGNTAGNGGGLYVRQSGNATINISTISGNYAQNGGGIFNKGTFDLFDSTITRNSADVKGGALYNKHATYSIATLTASHSIVSGNSSPNGSEVYREGGVVTGDASLFGDSSLNNAAAFINFMPDINNIIATSDGTNPTMLASILNPMLSANGGPTLTHALVSGSPAIDVVATSRQVSAATCTSGELDQRGAPRANGAGQGGTACDLGAYEYDSSAVPVAVNMQTFEAELESSWLPIAVSGLLATASGWVMGRKYR